MEYKFNGKITFDDFVQMNSHYIMEYFFKRKDTFIFIMLTIGYIGFNIYSIIIDKWYPFLKYTFISLLVIIILIVMTFILIRSKKFYRRLYESNKLTMEEQNFTLNEKEISINSESVNTKLTKEKVYKIEMDKDSIYIFTGENITYIIKARYFETKMNIMD
jgi:hypothetical protein